MPSQPSPFKRPKLAHIVETMDPPPVPDKTPPRIPPKAPRMSYAQTARPTPPSISTGTNSKDRGRGMTRLVPMSAFNTALHHHHHHHHRAWQPRCNHITMSRVYHLAFRCEHCHRPGPLGWLYRCTQDRELMIRDHHGRGDPVAFDDLGRALAAHMTLGPFGPDARSDPYSLLREMTPEQMSTYTPGQIATLLAQRDNVRRTAAAADNDDDNGNGNARAEPWTPTPQAECQYKICHACYRGGQDKAYLSLDGVAAGVVPPTAATAYSFQYVRDRPVLDARLVSVLGCRAVPLPLPREGSLRSTSSSRWSVMEIIDAHLDGCDDGREVSASLASSERTVESAPVWWADRAAGHRGGSVGGSQLLGGLAPPPVSHMLPPPGVSPLSASKDSEEEDGQDGGLATLMSASAVRPAWSPPPSPARRRRSRPSGKGVSHGAFGRSPSSLKLNPSIREKVFATIPLHASPSPHDNDDDDAIALACTTPLPRVGIDEELFLAAEKTAMEEEEEEEGVFHAEPLLVPGGVALTEEGVEEGLADIVAV